KRRRDDERPVAVLGPAGSGSQAIAREAQLEGMAAGCQHGVAELGQLTLVREMEARGADGLPVEYHGDVLPPGASQPDGVRSGPRDPEDVQRVTRRSCDRDDRVVARDGGDQSRAAREAV